MPRLPLLVWGLWTFERFWKSLQYVPKQATYVEKLLKELCARFTGWVREVNDVSQVNGNLRFGSVLCPAGWVGRECIKEQQHLPALLTPGKAALTPALIAIALKLVNLVPSCRSLTLFELLPLC